MASNDANILTERFYSELHEIAERIFARESSGHTLQPTAVVNEACMRLLSSSKLPDVPREEKLALAGRVLKQVLIDHARARAADKRGGGLLRLELDGSMWAGEHAFLDFSEVNHALETLRTLHARQAEVITLRIFGGLSMQQIASVLGVSKRTAEDDWTVARAWLRKQLAGGEPEHGSDRA